MAKGRNEEIRQLLEAKGAPGTRELTEAEKVFIYDAVKGLIHKIALNWCKCVPRAELDDLAQVGYLGLEKAMQKYSSDGGAVFSSFAADVINAEISIYVKKCGGLPAHCYAEIRQYKAALRALQEQGNDTPTADTIAEAMGITADAVNRIATACSFLNAARLDEPAPGAVTPLVDSLEAPPLDVDAAIDNAERDACLYGLIDGLPGEQGKVIRCRYLEEMSVNETAKVMQEEPAEVQRLAHCGIMNLHNRREVLKPYYDEWRIKSIAYKRSGLKTWRQQWESSTEYAAIKELEAEARRLIAELKAAT